MPRHRRYPVKKKQKIKAGDEDPLRASKPKAKSQFNAPPANEDEQVVPRRLKEIQKAAEAAASQSRRKSSKKGPKSSFYALTAKSGFKQRPWEDVDMLANRVLQSKNKEMNEEMLKVSFFLLISITSFLFRRKWVLLVVIQRNWMPTFECWMKRNDRKKALKIARAEKRRKMREKEERFIAERAAQGNQEADSNDEEQPMDDEDSSDEDQIEAKEEPPLKKTKKSKTAEMWQQRKRLTSSEKKRLRKKNSRAEAQKHLILNAREIIPFGERADAPPVFSKSAGKKDLLLKSLFKTNQTTTSKDNESDDELNAAEGVIGKPKRRVTEADRLRVIDAYRNLKKSKEQNAF
ncbi:hypothetical protein M3Y98_00143200 [Aphelenchoides besseyi]|nr:hypothetical protein M3Y98_00143200 [Aphelenchoides besseyi]